ncbi:conserved hypothetical protein [Candidatus Phytoplasma mali]|uniref:Uncharacterized protein n=1 Tax=Phytoplasma mali (strain AT) TaxID=482235 RepID=B3R0J2_PHYMT|nr:hypothetical protein [Candidatus Phytoplasma mali]CAP18356.1 conserved hypothetical protein [Candidatus Phytoplasma mali]
MSSSEKNFLKNPLDSNNVVKNQQILTNNNKNEEILQEKIKYLDNEFLILLKNLNEENWKNIFVSKNNLKKIMLYQKKLKEEKIYKDNKKQKLLIKELIQQKNKNKLKIQNLHIYCIKQKNQIQKQTLEKIQQIEAIFFKKNENIDNELKFLEKKQIQQDYNHSQQEQILNKIFKEKNTYFNSEINIINKDLQEKIILNIKKNQKNKDILEELEKKNLIIFEKKINKTNDIYQQNFFLHYKVFDQIQKDYLEKKKDLQNKIKKCFDKKKIIYFIHNIFLPIMSNNNNIYKIFLKLFNKIKKNNLIHLKKLTFWRQKNFFLKLSNQKKIKFLNYINFLEIQKFKYKKKQDEIIFDKNQQQLQLFNSTQINFIKMQTELSLNINKEKKYLLDIKHYDSKEEIQNKKIQLQIEKEIILHEFEYEKNLLILNQIYQQKKNLLILQLKLEKNKFQLKDIEKIYEKRQQIINLEQKIENLKFFNNVNIQINYIFHNQEKKNFFTKYQIQKHKIKNLLEKSYLKQDFNLKQILEFVKKYIFFDEIMEITNPIFCNINYYLKQININQNIFTENLNKIHNLFNFISTNIIDKKYQNYYFFYQKKYLFEKQKINNEIKIVKEVISYYENNLSFIRQLIQKKQNISYDNKYRLNYFLEKKIKKYEKNNLILKKNLKNLNNKNKILFTKHQKNISKLKQEQFRIIEINNILQIELLNNLNQKNLNIKNNKLFQKYRNNLLQKKFLKILKKFQQNINFIYEQNKLQKNKIIKNFNFFKKEKNNMVVLKNNLIEENQKKIDLFYDLVISIIENINIINQQYKNKNKLEEKIHLQKEKKQIINVIKNQFVYMKNTSYLIEENLKEAHLNIIKEFKEEKKKLTKIFNFKQEELNLKLKKRFLYFQKIKKLKKNNEHYNMNYFQNIKKKLLYKFKQKKNKNDKIIEKINFIMKKNNFFLKIKIKKIIFLEKIKLFFNIILIYFKYLIKKIEIKKNKNKNKKQIKKKFDIEKKIYLLNI